MDELKEVKNAYNSIAERFLISRSQNIGIMGFQNREVEQPTMYSLVPNKLNNNKLLDLGCGPGIHLKEYSKRGAQCFGLDLSEEMIKLAQKNCPQAIFKVGSVYQIDYEDNYFDIVTASFLLDNVKDLNKAITEIKRVMKK
ncbi:MAG: class I SAM-dependent methyltransferase, partial [Pseudomonadota bacterium]